MAQPPTTPPSSDIQGVDRDARISSTDRSHPDPGGAIDRAGRESAARPDESAPLESGTGKGPRE